MQPRTFHGDVRVDDFANALLAEFNRGNFEAQAMGDDERVVVQVRTQPLARSGGQTALTVSIHQIPDGVMVSIGEQAWLGVAASLGTSAIAAVRNPFSLLGRLDDIAQDLESLGLAEQVWRVIGHAALSVGASTSLGQRLRRVTCDYCGVANPVGEGSCTACGAPLGAAQPVTCPNCGFVADARDSICSNCGKRLRA